LRELTTRSSIVPYPAALLQSVFNIWQAVQGYVKRSVNIKSASTESFAG